MGATNLLRSVLGLLLVVNIAHAVQWDWDFGHRTPFDELVSEKEGEIGLFSYRNTIPIDVPLGEQVTDVHVTVWSVSAPDVDYNERTRTVSIVYSWHQITVSSYKITVNGIPLLPQHDDDKSIHIYVPTDIQTRE